MENVFTKTGEKAWEKIKWIYLSFMDLEKAYDREAL